MSHTSVSVEGTPNEADIEPVKLAAATDPGFIVLDLADASRWKACNASSSEALAGADGVAVLLSKVEREDDIGMALRPKNGRTYKLKINTLGASAEGAAFALGGSGNQGSAVLLSSLSSTDYITQVGVAGTEGSTDTVDELYLQFLVTGHQKP